MKLVAEAGVGTVAAGVAKAGADLIVIAGDSGGTGASPLSSIKRAGVPWEIGLAEAHQTLVLNGLRDRVRLQVDGQLKTGRDVVIAALLGADEFGFATAPLIVEGCVMMRKCHLNTCPVGIATQDPVLREKFTGRPEHLVNYFFFVAEEVRELMARLGARTVERAGWARRPAPTAPDGPRTIAARRSTSPPICTCRGARRRAAVSARSGWLAQASDLDTRCCSSASALDDGTPFAPSFRFERRSLRRSGDRRRDRASIGRPGLPEDTIVLRFDGSAGQSFGAFAARGLSLELEGEANDYVGKGLSGGRFCRSSARPRALPAQRNADRRQHGVVRSDVGRAVSRRRARRSGSPCATAARSRWSKAWAITAAST